MTPAAHQPLSLDKQIQLEQLKHSNLQLQLELAKLSPNVQITVTCVPILRGGFIFCSIIMACLSSHPMSRSQILIFCLCFGENFKRSFPPTILAITLHINQGPTNTRPGRPGQPKQITGQVYFFTKKPTGPP